MDKCPKCGHWNLTYEVSKEKWICYCQHIIYNNLLNEGCHCNHEIPESNDSWRKRLLIENHKGRYSVDPPVN
jgi:transcription initiation factor TFIIIB Brf1 subunit/transcription initiation factor TFIIB